MNHKILLTALAMSSAASLFATSPMMYPAPPTGPVTDKYFNLEVMDAFRPLENDTSQTTLAWVKAENALMRYRSAGLLNNVCQNSRTTEKRGCHGAPRMAGYIIMRMTVCRISLFSTEKIPLTVSLLCFSIRINCRRMVQWL